MKNFVYYEPRTIAETCDLLSTLKADAKILAGGTALLILMKQRMLLPRCIINIKRIKDLDYIDYDENSGLRIGALATYRSLETSKIIREHYPVMARALSEVGSVAIRHMATIGGGLCHAEPAEDLPPVLMALDARAKISSSTGDRTLSLDEFFLDFYSTALMPDEVLTEVQIPLIREKWEGTYLKLSVRRALDIAIVGVAALMKMADSSGLCQDAKIVLSGVGSTPLKIREAEVILKDKKFSEILAAEASSVASMSCNPASDIRGSAAYKKDMVKVLTARALRQLGTTLGIGKHRRGN